MDVVRSAGFLWVLTWIGVVLAIVGFAATRAEDRQAFKVIAAIVLLTVAVLFFVRQ